jgi:hypothetical protein
MFAASVFATSGFATSGFATSGFRIFFVVLAFGFARVPCVGFGQRPLVQYFYSNAINRPRCG